MANVPKLWKGAVEPAESGASGNEYQAWKGAVEPAGPNVLLATSVESTSEVTTPALVAINVLLATSVESASEVSTPSAGTIIYIVRKFNLTGVYDQDRDLTGEAN